MWVPYQVSQGLSWSLFPATETPFSYLDCPVVSQWERLSLDLLELDAPWWGDTQRGSLSLKRRGGTNGVRES